MTITDKKNRGIGQAILHKIKYRILREFFREHSYHKKNVVDDLIISDVFTFSGQWKETFLKAMRHNLEHHVKNSEFFRKQCAAKKFEPRLASFDEIWEIPFIMCDVFKHYDIETRTGDLMTMWEQKACNCPQMILIEKSASDEKTGEFLKTLAGSLERRREEFPPRREDGRREREDTEGKGACACQGHRQKPEDRDIRPRDARLDRHIRRGEGPDP